MNYFCCIRFYYLKSHFDPETFVNKLHSHTKKKNVKTHGPDHIYLMFLRSLIPNPWSI